MREIMKDMYGNFIDIVKNDFNIFGKIFGTPILFIAFALATLPLLVAIILEFLFIKNDRK